MGLAVFFTPDLRGDQLILDGAEGRHARVVRRIAAMTPRRVAYVACDPAALARDLKTFGGLGYGIASLRAFDLFGMTHHIECVAILEPVDSTAGRPHEREVVTVGGLG